MQWISHSARTKAPGAQLTLALAAGLGVASAAVAEIEPVPSEMMPLAAESLLLDVENIGTRFIAVGERGHILASKDGANWAQAEVPARSLLTAVDFVDDTHGWAVGHDATILHTNDGGESWSIQNFEPKAERPLLDVKFLNRDRGFAVGSYGHFYTTDDGGRSWDKNVHGMGIDAPEWAVFQWPGADNEDAVYEMEDEMLDFDAAHINGLIQLNDNSLLAVGELGLLALSRDGGRSWQLIESPYEGSFFNAVPMGRSGAVVFGLRGNTYVSRGFIDPNAAAADDAEADADMADEIVALDGGWRRIDMDTTASLQGGTLLPDGSAIVVGLNGTVKQVAANGSARTVISADQVEGSVAAVVAQDGHLLLVGSDGTQIISQ